MTRPRPKPESLLALLKSNRNAITVYGALRWLSGEKRQINTSRAAITEITRLHRSTITKAVTALHDGGWICRCRGHATNRRWYRITFASEEFFPCNGKTVPSARKKSSILRAGKPIPSAMSKDGENHPKRAKRLRRKNRPNSLEGVGASYGPAPSPTGGAERTPTQGALQHPENTECGGPAIPIAEILELTND